MGLFTTTYTKKNESLRQIAIGEKRVLAILQDNDAESPRTAWDNLGTMVCWHRNYDLGDKHTYEDRREFLFELVKEHCFDFLVAKAEGKEDAQDWIDYDAKDELALSDLYSAIQQFVVILPLFLYDHSGITMRTTGFHCPWDSGQVGFIYCSKERFLKETGYTSEQLFDEEGKAVEILRNEVKTYDDYLTGNTYGYQLYDIDTEALTEYLEAENLTKEKLEDRDLEDFLNEVDSCWGFYGNDHKENGIADSLSDGDRELVDKLKSVY